MVSINLFFFLLFSCFSSFANGYFNDSTKLRKKIELKIGFVYGIIKNEENQYFKEKEFADDFYYNLKIKFACELPSPQLNINYLIQLHNKFLSNSNLLLGIGYSTLKIKSYQSGYYQGGIQQTYFKGIIEDEKLFSFINVSVGHYFEKKIINNIYFGISSFFTEKFNFLTKNKHIEQNEYAYYSNKFNMNYNNSKTHSFLNKQDYTNNLVSELSLTTSFSKKIKKNNYGVYIGYSITNYSISNRAYSILDYSFLKNYNLIQFGLIIKI